MITALTVCGAGFNGQDDVLMGTMTVREYLSFNVCARSLISAG